MNCDLCGKKITFRSCREDDSVDGSRLCPSCYAKIKNHNEDDCLFNRSQLETCPKCKKGSQTLYQVQDELLCLYCCEELENASQSYPLMADYCPEEGAVPNHSSGLSTFLGFLSVALMIFGVFFQIATLIAFALPICLLINLATLATAAFSQSPLSKVALAVSGAQLFLNLALFVVIGHK